MDLPTASPHLRSSAPARRTIPIVPDAANQVSAFPAEVSEHLLKALGVMAAVIAPDGRSLSCSGLHRICSQFHHSDPAARAICLLHDTQRTADLIAAHPEGGCYSCPNGLEHVFRPIEVDGLRVGTLLIGQFLFVPPNRADFARRAGKLDLDLEPYLKALDEIPVLDAARVEAALKLLQGYGAAIAQQWANERAAADASADLQRFAARSRAAARDREPLLATLLDQLPGLVSVQDDQGRYEAGNRGVAELYGCAPQDLIGRRPRDFLASAREAAELEASAFTALAGDHELESEHRLHHSASGEQRSFHITRKPLVGADGRKRLVLIGQDTTAIDEARRTAESAHRRFEMALRLSGDGVAETDLASGRIEHNAQWATLMGLDPARSWHSAHDVLPRIHPDDHGNFAERLAAFRRGEERASAEYRILLPGGGVRWVRAIAGVIERDPSGLPLRLLGRITDISGKRAEREAQRIAAVAFESQDALVVTDAEGHVLRVNQAFTDLTGYTPEQIRGKTTRMLRSERHPPEFYTERAARIQAEGRWSGEVWNRRADGSHYLNWLKINAVRNEAGEVTHFVSSSRDITELRAAEERISQLAFYDALTGLPNRRLLLDRLAASVQTHARWGYHGALVFLDLDHFKTLNDTLGHDVGDQLLVLVAERLRATLRASDTVARLGGDEFVLILERVGKTRQEAAECAMRVADKVRAALAEPFALLGHVHHGGASLGVTLFNTRFDSTERLLKQADLALYKAKAAGRNQVRFYSPELEAAARQRADTESGLRHALAAAGFELLYQPQVDAKRRVVGAEALLRWRKPDGEQVLPGRFMAIAEETGLIVPIGDWVLDAACAQLALWAEDPLTAELSLSVNISARQARQANFVEIVQETVQRHGVDPARLKLELTESLVIADVDQVIAKMEALREIGVSFSLDDFGTGYSSLAALRKLPLDQIKIDRSFIDGLGNDEEDSVIVRAVLAMSRSLQLPVLAEGVETEAQFRELRELGCEAFQGYLFGRPMSATALQAEIAATR